MQPQAQSPPGHIPSRTSETGFSLTELTIALAVFVFVATSSLYVFGQATRIVRSNEDRSIAANLAAGEIDRVRGMEFSNIPLGQTTRTEDVDGVEFTITTETQFVPRSSSTGACDSPIGSDYEVLRVDAIVTWANMGPVQPVANQTIITPPAGTYSQTTGHIAVTVRDRDAQPLDNTEVTVQSSSEGVFQQQQTTSDGCAFFGYLPPTDDYIVSLNRTGYVDGENEPSPSRENLEVLVQNTTPVVFDYDEAASLLVNIDGQFGGVVPPNVPITLANNHYALGTKVFDQGSGDPRQLDNLFPYADGYEGWAGDCAGADPETYVGATRDPTMVVEPGQLTQGSLTAGSVDVEVLEGVVPVEGATIRMVHATDTDPSCTELTVGTTDADGMLSIAAPYGTWEFRVEGRNPATVWPVQLVTPTDVAPPPVAVIVQ